MQGSLVNLNQPGTRLPVEAVLDTNLLITYFLAAQHPKEKTRLAQVRPLFNEIQSGNTAGYVTSDSVRELLHKLIVTKYDLEYKTNKSQHFPHLRKRWPNRNKFSGYDLIKTYSRLLRQYASDLDRLCNLMIATGVIFLQPGDCASLGAATTLEKSLVDYIRDFQVDTSDASILLEAHRAGINSIVTFDSDFDRARSAFHVYTWK